MSAERRDSLLTFGHWDVSFLPAGWEFVPNWGLRRNEGDVFTSNVSLVEEQLLEGQDLQTYVECQMMILRRHVSDARVNGPEASIFPGADEALKTVIHYKALDGLPIVQHQIYARRRRSVGVLTCTTIEDQIRFVQPAFDSICKATHFCRRAVLRKFPSVTISGVGMDGGLGATLKSAAKSGAAFVTLEASKCDLI